MTISMRRLGFGSAPFILFVLAISLFAACTFGADPSRAQAEPLLVAAAASLETAFNEIGQAFTAGTGQPVDFVFGSSGNLATQIENGAPFDLFAAADESFMDRLAERDPALVGSKAIYAQGQLVLAVKTDSGITVTSLEELTEPNIGPIAIANPELAPYGKAAKQALQNTGLWDAAEPRIVQGANVRQALQYVQTGDAEVGLVALSIADAPDITYTRIDSRLHEPLNQTIAVVANTDQPAQAAAFIDFLLSEESRAVLTKHGYTLSSGSDQP